MKILCIGDAHLGRFPTRVPDNSPELAVRFVWERSVRYATDHEVDAVVLTGDMVDSSNHYFEAYGAFKQGVQQLVGSGIPVFAVAGNHDHDVFPRLASDLAVENFTVLGVGGHWSEALLETPAGETACFVGWSFPDLHFRRSPLDTLELPSVDVPIVGIVHGDIDASSGAYAPLSLSALQQQQVAVWLLGHIHGARWIEDQGTPVLYPGSLQALDPGETGIHGPWLVTVSPDGEAKAEQLPFATARYERVQIDISQLSELDDASSHIAQCLDRRTQELSGAFPELRHIVFRPSITGRTSLHRSLSRQLLADATKLEFEFGTLHASVDKITLATTPKHDLVEIARFGDPPAILAQWLLNLDKPECEALRKEVQKVVQRVYGSNAYSTLGSEAPTGVDTADLLLRQGQLLLDELMSQKDNA